MTKVRIEDYGVYGLNRHRSFLESDIINLDNLDELIEFINEMLIEHECLACAIFAITYSDQMIAGFTAGTLNEIYYTSNEEVDLDFFATLDGELRFCCYSLLIEIRPGIWRIIE